MSRQTVVTARMPFIRLAHTEEPDGFCHQCEVVWPCDAGTVLMALAAQTTRAEAAEARERERLRTALEPLRQRLAPEWWREDEKDWYVTCSVCDASGPREDFWHFDDCVLGAALAAQTTRAEAAEARERERLRTALENTARELQAWHDERPCSPAMKAVCVSCGYLEEAVAILAASPGSQERGDEPWERVAAAIERFLAEIDEEPPVSSPTAQQRARGAYAAVNVYSAEIKSGPHRESQERGDAVEVDGG